MVGNCMRLDKAALKSNLPTIILRLYWHRISHYLLSIAIDDYCFTLVVWQFHLSSLAIVLCLYGVHYY